jgi:protein-disulfide isomerase
MMFMKIFTRITTLLLVTVFYVSVTHAADKQSSPTPAPSTQMTVQQKLAFEKIIRDYLLRNPEVIVEAMQILRGREKATTRLQREKTLAHMKKDIYEDPSSPIGGNSKGDVTIVEFFDYNCGYCKKVHPTVVNLLKSDGNIRYVFKEFPILGNSSVIAARIALAAWDLDKSKYSDFHTALMQSRGGLSESKILRLAKKTGYDEAKLKVAMTDPKIEASIRKNHAIAQALNITGTPAFIIGNQVIPGAISAESMKKIISEIRGG